MPPPQQEDTIFFRLRNIGLLLFHQQSSHKQNNMNCASAKLLNFGEREKEKHTINLIIVLWVYVSGALCVTDADFRFLILVCSLFV
jgi:hypothetical protein